VGVVAEEGILVVEAGATATKARST
jgi:hypothetical protein